MKERHPGEFSLFFEPIILFIRDDVAKPFLGNHTYTFLPYLLTLFFFIWFSNLLGLTPFNSNIAGNISVTAALALLSMILINWNGSKDYWSHIFLAPGLPRWLLPLMIVVELIGGNYKAICSGDSFICKYYSRPLYGTVYGCYVIHFREREENR